MKSKGYIYKIRIETTVKILDSQGDACVYFKPLDSEPHTNTNTNTHHFCASNICSNLNTV